MSLAVDQSQSGQSSIQPSVFSTWLKALGLATAVATVLLIGARFNSALAADSAGTPKSVLVLYRMEKNTPGAAIFDQSLRAEFQSLSTDRITFYTEFLGLSGINDEASRQELLRLCRLKYVSRKLDLVVVAGVGTTQDLINAADGVSPGTPIIFIQVGQTFRESPRLRPGVTGVVMKLEYQKTLDLALRLQPETRRVVVIAGTSQEDQQLQAQAQEEFRQDEGKVEFTYLTNLTLEGYRRAVSQLPAQTIIFYLAISHDATGEIFYSPDTLSLLAQAANVPIYGISETYLGRGMVGGRLPSYAAQGVKAAEMGARILRGEDPSNLPISTTGLSFDLFDWRQLQRWGIKENKLPPGSIVRYQELSFWRHYKQYIVSAITVIIAQTLLIAFLLLERAKRRRATQALRQSEEHVRWLIEHSHSAILLFDHDGNYLQANQAACDLLGYRREQLLNMKVSDLLATEAFDPATRALNYYEQGFETGDCAFVRPDGERCILQFTVSRFTPELHVSIVRDVTERYRAEEQFQQFFELPLVGMAITSPDRRFLLVNQKLCEMLGRSEPELTSLTWAEVTHPADIAENVRLLEQTLQGETDGYRMEKRFIHRDGHVIYAGISARCVRRDDGAVDRLVLIVEDISERKQAEAELNQINAELEERIAARTAELATKTRELETFAYSVAHDLKAPLRGVEGYSRLLLEHHHDHLDHDGRHFLHSIRASTDRMNQLIDELLAYSRFERRELTFSQIDLRAFVEALIAEKRTELEERRIQVSLAVNGGSVVADPSGLGQVLRNYLDNAIKFTRQVPEPQIEIGAAEMKKHCRLWVRDNGIGFDMKHHDCIFDIFQRLHTAEDYPGTGVGLAIARKVMERLGGRVWAESAPQQGATFYLELPKLKRQSANIKEIR